MDRVDVLIEKMSIKNRHSKEFGVDLGLLLQQSVDDKSRCVVRMSQPHLFASAVSSTISACRLYMS